jgi:hypothetical protein
MLINHMIKHVIYIAMFSNVLAPLKSDVSHCQKRKSLYKFVLDSEEIGIYSAI